MRWRLWVSHFWSVRAPSGGYVNNWYFCRSIFWPSWYCQHQADQTKKFSFHFITYFFIFNIYMSRLDFHSAPPFFNHLPPTDELNTPALGYIGSYPESFRTFSLRYVTGRLPSNAEIVEVSSSLFSVLIFFSFFYYSYVILLWPCFVSLSFTIFYLSAWNIR